LVAAAVGVWLAAWNYPHFDTYVHLTWARDVLDGHGPGFDSDVAPTEHPLWLAISIVLVVVAGAGADHAINLVTMLSWAAMIAATYRLAACAMGSWVAVLAAALVASSASFLLYAFEAYVDVPFVALILWAAVLEAERSRRGVSVMVLLSLAGLLRPEAWMFAGVYFLWLASGETRARHAAGYAGLAGLAPAIWIGLDWTVTGDPLFSLHSTRSGAEALGRTRGIENVPTVLLESIGQLVRKPVAAAGLLGLGLAVAILGVRRQYGLLVVGALGLAAFAGIGVAGLSLLPRYLFAPGIVVAVFAAFAVFGWTTLPEAVRWRRWWKVASIVAVLGAIVGIALKDNAVGRYAALWADQRATHRALTAIVRDPQVQAAARCGALSFPGTRLVPDARWILDLPPDAVVPRTERRPVTAVGIYVPGPEQRKYSFNGEDLDPLVNTPPGGQRRIAKRGPFVAYANC